jgi:hypothetical protein
MTSSSALAAAVPLIIPFLSSPNATFSALQQDRVDAALWTLGDQTLLLVANPNPSNTSILLEGVTGGTATQLFNGGGDLVVQNDGVVLRLEGIGTAGWIFQH